MEKYFSTHRHYFISVATATTSIGAASMKEKEMVASLFCKLASLLRYKFSAFGSDTRIAVRCLQVLVRATDAKSLVKNCYEFIRTSMLMFFNNAADDLSQCLGNLYEVRLIFVCDIKSFYGVSLFPSSCSDEVQFASRNPFEDFFLSHLCSNGSTSCFDRLI